MSSLLVTGGCGFIGSNFVRMLLGGKLELAELGFDRLVNLDALTYAGNLANLEEFKGDARYRFAHGRIGDCTMIEDLMRSEEVSAVVNFAAESHVDRSIDGPEAFIKANVVETQKLLSVVKDYWSALDGTSKESFRFLHVSTDEVYGSLGEEDPAFCETTAYAPNSPYAATKAASDFLVRSYYHTYGLPVVTTNCSNNYGPYQFPEKLIPLMILNALEGKSLPVYGDGLNIRDWLFVEDHCRGLWKALANGKLGETYCIGGKNEIQNIRIVELICDLLEEYRPRQGGGSYRDLIAYVKDRPGHDRRYAIDCSKMERELGWSPRESFESGIRKTVLWYLENGDWCREISESKYGRKRLGML